VEAKFRLIGTKKTWSLSKLFPWLLKELVHEIADTFEEIFINL